jgi:hypothetical protein
MSDHCSLAMGHTFDVTGCAGFFDLQLLSGWQTSAAGS